MLGGRGDGMPVRGDAGLPCWGTVRAQAAADEATARRAIASTGSLATPTKRVLVRRGYDSSGTRGMPRETLAIRRSQCRLVNVFKSRTMGKRRPPRQSPPGCAKASCSGVPGGTPPWRRPAPPRGPGRWLEPGEGSPWAPPMGRRRAATWRSFHSPCDPRQGSAGTACVPGAALSRFRGGIPRPGA